MRNRQDVEVDARERQLDWYQRDVVAVVRALGSRETGLTATEVSTRLSTYGKNEIGSQKTISPFTIFFGQFKDFMILLLLGAAVVSGVVGELKDTLVIAGVLVLNAVIGFIQEYRAERAMEALRTLAARQATVIRENHHLMVPASDLAPGDLVVLEAGMVVPADLRLMESFTLRIEEAALTGESGYVDKVTDPIVDDALPLGDRVNMAYLGTTVTHGRGRGVVVATGPKTEFGKIATMLQQTEASRTPLQRRLEHFGKRLSFAALTISAVVLLLGVVRGQPILLMAMTAISLAVAAIPEALPAVVTISLALGARRMVQKRALIRKLPAVETLGSVTVICSDKTGTLTMNRMTVEQFYCDGVLENRPRTDGRWPELLQAMAISNDVRSEEHEGPVAGDSTELALVAAAQAAGLYKAEIEVRYPRVAEAPFDSERKLMTTVHRHPAGGFISYTKGAAEAVVARLGEVQYDSQVSAIADQMAGQGRRVLALATRRWPQLPSVDPAVVESNLTFLGLTAIGDPARPEALEAVRLCRNAGIVPVMITGDHPATARSIARELEITRKDEVLTGRDLATMSSEEIGEKVLDTRVSARVAPEQKYQIVNALQAGGHVVAMTGDGVNDAPALKRADIGIAMGLTGTDVTKESSSMILLDDNFATIVAAVREGRVIYDNLRRFIRYALTTNASEVWIMFVASVVGLPIPLLPVQILWINLITDGLPGLTLAAEPAEPDVMTRPPRPPQESVFAHGLGIHVVWVSVLMAALALGVHWKMVQTGSESAQTMVLTVVGFSQLAHVLAIRSEKQSLFSLGLLSNLPLFWAVMVTAVLQIAVIYVPIMNDWFRTAPMSITELTFCIGISSVVFLAVEIEKWLVRRGTLRYR